MSLRKSAASRRMAGVKVPYNLRLIALALVVLVIIGVAGFHFIEGWSWFDGFYMVLTTITSIGYGEIHPLSHAGRLFNSFIIITGVGLVLLLVGGASRTLLEFELQSVFGRRRMEREISRLTGHFIICGAGRVGRSAARELARKPLPFVVVDTSEEKLQKYSSEGWLTLVGDATLAKVLQQANIEKARGSGCSHNYGRDQHLHHPHGPQPESQAQDHCSRLGRRRRKASADGRRRFCRLALQFRRLSHCADVHAAERGRFLRHRDEPEAPSGNRRSQGG